MFTFQSIMFVSLGFLCALLLGFVVAPAFWARAVRLTTERMRASLPLTEQEISADRDRLRAENAIRVHQLTAKIERARLYDARQKVEINRRDGTISSLERRLQLLETEREGSENARRVLEATINQRVPEVESRLMEARQLLAKRDAEMKALQNDTGRTFRALDDAMQVNAQQRAEIDRLKMSLAGHGARSQSVTMGGETEAALRAELETVRARAREQAALIDKLQGRRSGNASDGGKRSGLATDSGAVRFKSVVANDDDAGWTPPAMDDTERTAKQAEIENLKAKLAEQSVKMEALTAQLATYEDGATSKSRSLSLRETKTALKAKAAASDKELAARNKTIEGLRRELAVANERIARQASYYQDELRRLGASGVAARGNGQAGGRSIAAAPRSEVTSGSLGAGSAAANVPSPALKPEAGGELILSAPERSTPRAAEILTVDPGSDSGVAAKKSLESRLAETDEAVEVKASDFDKHEMPNESDEEAKPQRSKLMDRIAGLAKT